VQHEVSKLYGTLALSAGTLMASAGLSWYAVLASAGPLLPLPVYLGSPDKIQRAIKRL